MKFSIVVAVDINRGIGRNNALPWHLPGDLKHFKELTGTAPDGKRNAVIMGRKTWDSLPAKFKPLPRRLNIVLSRQADLNLPGDCLQAHSLDEALELCDKSSQLSEAYVIGGAQLYALALKHPLLKRVYVTEINADFQCDCFFPDYAGSLMSLPECRSQADNGVDYCFRVLEPIEQE